MKLTGLSNLETESTDNRLRLNPYCNIRTWQCQTSQTTEEQIQIPISQKIK